MSENLKYAIPVIVTIIISIVTIIYNQKHNKKINKIKNIINVLKRFTKQFKIIKQPIEKYEDISDYFIFKETLEDIKTDFDYENIPEHFKKTISNIENKTNNYRSERSKSLNIIKSYLPQDLNNNFLKKELLIREDSEAHFQEASNKIAVELLKGSKRKDFISDYQNLENLREVYGRKNHTPIKEYENTSLLVNQKYEINTFWETRKDLIQDIDDLVEKVHSFENKPSLRDK
ncbi:MAG: hypothetical protein KAX49_19925 [Halanaerobiales bacterium]|nr:hypothetical protein [Halanaerobiales bacterium]